MKKEIKIKFINGITYEAGIQEILNCVADKYSFVKTEKPDFIIFGPYGNDIPPKGEYIRIGYYCENMTPDMNLCDWAFGVPYEEEINNPRYMRIQWHGFDPNVLVKTNLDLDAQIAQKTKFCNFIYSNKVPLREQFYRALSKYKPVDAPGKSMNNMPGIDSTIQQTSKWKRKRDFLSQYKFTIAFENYSYPGYNTEKLLDPMVVNSLPIYWGNPYIGRHFNTNSFVNTHDYFKENRCPLLKFVELNSNADFKDMRPLTFIKPGDKIKRKFKSISREIKIKILYSSFDEIIEKIIEIDRDDTLYAKYLSEPWFYQNKPPSNESVVNRWQEIFG
ncbi:hypothetical protein NIES37_58610 [Tolypothrix tenuis PCC 7101]|uniref:Uncharacterized protein n=1 Tax=Tolypothrix tenuis PCC 7101 TaxID=231146 RepID=A0A1Z4N801_9CYAN|nr:hypothetical protein [Aulosira sp. FACHB-113]BAZ01854.1 hypothetical protein NIES37_58610 [Tolypothrix tenuis PCC 7101]BAZ74221.1 hypothetical protein NIES50_27920 [Aulosira laxa NIES-50]